MRGLSILGFVLIVIALVALLKIHALFSPKPWVIALQVAAALLMLWARVTFGMRSFHADAKPTAGGLVTSGPYRYIRHPIYAAICMFIWAGVLAHLSPLTILLGFLATVGVLVRLRCEETLVTERYPEYRDYAARTKRLVPGLW
ncbi:MAG: methyltransferase family protein [Chthoniobacterales bacterium]